METMISISKLLLNKHGFLPHGYLLNWLGTFKDVLDRQCIPTNQVTYCTNRDWS